MPSRALALIVALAGCAAAGITAPAAPDAAAPVDFRGIEVGIGFGHPRDKDIAGACAWREDMATEAAFRVRNSICKPSPTRRGRAACNFDVARVQSKPGQTGGHAWHRMHALLSPVRSYFGSDEHEYFEHWGIDRSC